MRLLLQTKIRRNEILNLVQVFIKFFLKPFSCDTVNSQRRRRRRRRRRNSTKYTWSTKEEQKTTVLQDLTRLFLWLQYYYNIYLIETKGQQGERLLPTHSFLQLKLAGRGSDNI